MENRVLRFNSKIKKKLSEIILFDLNDPRFSEIISITWIKTSPNFSSCKIGISVLKDEVEKRKKIVKLLNKSAGFLKRRLSEELDLKAIPSLTFILDDNAIYADIINNILNELNSKSGNNKKN